MLAPGGSEAAVSVAVFLSFVCQTKPANSLFTTPRWKAEERLQKGPVSPHLPMELSKKKQKVLAN